MTSSIVLLMQNVLQIVEFRRISPLQQGEDVEVQGMAPEGEYMKEIFVEINWQGRSFTVPLSQLKAIEDWHYWAGRGYQY